MTNTENRIRWVALFVLCLGVLMEVLDSTIVTVALPSIKIELGFLETSLAWVVNAYLLTFGGFLLLGGRLGDLYGNRRLFLIGIALFTAASLACGLATTQWFLIFARAIQGIGGAIASAVSLSLMMNLFVTDSDRAKAMGFFGFVASAGGSIGVLLGGFLTTLNWHWIFLVNIPVGVAVLILSYFLLPHSKAEHEHHHLDVWGALTITLSLVLLTYAVVGGNQVGWLSRETLSLLGVAAILLGAFVYIESRVRNPLMPLGLLKIRTIWVSNLVGVLWAAAMFAWFFLSALYMQQILMYTPLQVGLAFLPSNIIMAIFSLGLSAKIVMRFGIRGPIAFGLGLASLGLLLLANTSIPHTLAPGVVDLGHFMVDILPSMILLGLGAGIAFNPVLLAAMSGVSQEESGLASGLVNTSFMMGGALGLAILVSIAALRTGILAKAGAGSAAALLSGYHSAFLLGAGFAILAAILGGVLLKVKPPAHAH
jgi:EmrB/QacA subfamily drug resistance transporter